MDRANGLGHCLHSSSPSKSRSLRGGGAGSRNLIGDEDNLSCLHLSSSLETSQPGPSTSSFSLVLASTKDVIETPSLFNNAIMDLEVYGSAFNIIYANPGGVARVNFFLDGVFERHDQLPPFTMAGDSQGKYYPLSLTPTSGTTYEIEI